MLVRRGVCVSAVSGGARHTLGGTGGCGLAVGGKSDTRARGSRAQLLLQVTNDSLEFTPYCTVD